MSQIFLQGAQPAIGFEQLTVSNTAKALTLSAYDIFDATSRTHQVAKIALITVEGDNVRWRMDNVNPTATVGHQILAGNGIELMSITQIRQIRFIRTTTDATINVTYFGS